MQLCKDESKTAIIFGYVSLLPIPAFMNTPKFDTICKCKTYSTISSWCISFKRPSTERQGAFIWHHLNSRAIDFAEHTSYRALYTWIIDVRHHLFIQIGIPWSIYPMLSPCSVCRSIQSLKRNLCDQLIFICIFIQQQWIIRIRFIPQVC